MVVPSSVPREATLPLVVGRGAGGAADRPKGQATRPKSAPKLTFLPVRGEPRDSPSDRTGDGRSVAPPAQNSSRAVPGPKESRRRSSTTRRRALRIASVATSPDSPTTSVGTPTTRRPRTAARSPRAVLRPRSRFSLHRSGSEANVPSLSSIHSFHGESQVYCISEKRDAAEH